MDCSTPGFSVLHHLLSLFKLMSIQSVMPSNHLILCRSLFLLPSIFPSIRVFPNESALRIRWSKYWSFSFSISPSNEYSGLISFRIVWFDLLAFQGTLKSYAEYLMQNARLDEAQAGIKIAGRNINNLRYAGDTTLLAGSEEELRSLLMKVKEESEKADFKLNIQKTKIMASSLITS